MYIWVASHFSDPRQSACSYNISYVLASHEHSTVQMVLPIAETDVSSLGSNVLQQVCTAGTALDYKVSLASSIPYMAMSIGR